MGSNSPLLANFLIAGTEKAGTTSVFVYLSQHPEVCASARKETDFFRREYTGDAVRDQAAYSLYFKRRLKTQRIVMEASPGYLGESRVVVPRIKTLLPETRILFILRNPIERLYSSYNFHIGKLNLPTELSFGDYVHACIAYDNDVALGNNCAIDEWQLKALRFGRYAENINLYYENFPRSNIKVMFFEDLRDDPSGFMTELSTFLEIDSSFWQDFQFLKSNVTFAARNKFVHRIAMYVNAAAEHFLLQRPVFKHSLVQMYKSINQNSEAHAPMADELRQLLAQYYSDSNRRLEEMLGGRLPDTWRA